MNEMDRKILTVLQKDGSISMAQLSERIGLSISACHRRVKMLEAAGVIQNYAASLDRKALGLELHVFIEAKLVGERREDMEAFEAAIRNTPEILECYMISGEFTYLLRVAAKNAEHYEKLYRERLSMLPSMSQMKTLLTLGTVKEFQGYHLG